MFYISRVFEISWQQFFQDFEASFQILDDSYESEVFFDIVFGFFDCPGWALAAAWVVAAEIRRRLDKSEKKSGKKLKKDEKSEKIEKNWKNEKKVRKIEKREIQT